MNSSPFIVCEVSANHLGSESRAHRLVEVAHECGADAVKFQTWTPGTMCVSDYKIQNGPWKGRALSDLYQEAHLPWNWHAGLFEHARELGLIPFSAAFDAASVDFLETLNVDRHKVASFELTDLPLIRYMASKGKPMILSTGMATWDELNAAYMAVDGSPGVLKGAFGYPEVTLLKCTSAYPADAADANLAVLRDELVYDWGLSDHTLGLGVACAAAALGATYIEKHLTLSRADGGPDAGFSSEPAEFKQMVTECRRAAAAIGVPSYGPGPNESTELRRSLWVIRDVHCGDRLVLGENVATARPNLGLPCNTYLANAAAPRAFKAGEPLTEIVHIE